MVRSDPVSELVVEDVAIDQLGADPPTPVGSLWNSRPVPSLEAFGFVQPVLARRDDGIIIAGHQRVVAARRAGRRTVPVVFLDLDPSRARALALALQPHQRNVG